MLKEGERECRDHSFFMLTVSTTLLESCGEFNQFKNLPLKKILSILSTEFATIIKTLVGGKHKMKLTKAVEDDPQRRKPDISRAKKFLNWEPKVSLNEGLKKTIEYFTKEVKRSQGVKVR